MQLENTFTVPVPVGTAWRVLLDVERIGPCLPGATVEEFDGTTARGKVKVKVGPITVTYNGHVRFVETDEAAHRAVLDASGKEARGNGTAKATVTTTMTEQSGSTRVDVVTDLNVTGRPAQFGRGVLADVSAKLIQQFADCLAAEVLAADGSAASEPPAAAPAEGATAAAPETGSVPASPVTAAAPLPPTGAPQEPAPAPARPLPPQQPAAPPRPRPSADAIDLLDAAGAPVLKRVAPVAGAVAFVVALVLWWRGRR